MSYESKMIIVNRVEFKTMIAGDVIAEFNLSVLPRKFDHKTVFTTPIDFDLFPDGNHATMEDKYGEHCCMANIKEVIAAFEELAAEDDYRRYKPFIALLKGFDEKQWLDIRVVHYGY